MQKISISGVSGFVGKNLLPYLANRSYHLHDLQLRNMPDHFLLGDSDIIVHLAGKAHDLKNVSTPGEYYQVNFELTKKLYDAFLISGASKFIFISSVKAAADHTQTTLTEDVIPDPLTEYGKSKLIACHGSFTTSSCVNCQFQVSGVAIESHVMSKTLPMCSSESPCPNFGRSEVVVSGFAFSEKRDDPRTLHQESSTPGATVSGFGRPVAHPTQRSS